MEVLHLCGGRIEHPFAGVAKHLLRKARVAGRSRNPHAAFARQPRTSHPQTPSGEITCLNSNDFARSVHFLRQILPVIERQGQGVVQCLSDASSMTIEFRHGKLAVTGKHPRYKFGVYRPAGVKEYGPAQPAWKPANFQPRKPSPTRIP